MFSDDKARVSVQIDAPAFRKPLEAPVRPPSVKHGPAPQYEQFSGAVEVVRKATEEAAASAPETAAQEPGYRSFQVIPHANIKNEKIDRFGDVLAETYQELYQRMNGGWRPDDPDRVFFETVITGKTFRTYVTTNAPLVDMVKQHANMTWKHITLTDCDADPLAGLDPVDAIAYELRLKYPFFLSLKTDRRLQETPLGEIMEMARGLAEDDRAVIQFGFQNAEPGWESIAEKDLQEWRQTKQKPRWWRGGREESPATSMKPARSGYDFVLRILVQSDDERRRRMIARGIIAALRQLEQDNVFADRIVRRWRMKKFIRRMQERHIRVPLFSNRRNIVTAPEIAHFVKLPQRSIQQEYAQVEAVTKPEVQLPDELFTTGPAINIGTVVERGQTRTARIPIKAFGSTSQEKVDDAYCLPEFIFGEMGSGKTSEAKHRAHSAILNGQTVFFFDTADGSAVRELHDSLPADYPEDKIIHLDLTNKAWPIALTWAFDPKAAAGVGGDAELLAEQAREAGRMFLRQFVGGMSTAEFSNKMERYLSVAARAASAAPLDIELALTSPSYREELMEREEVAAALDVVADLQAMQDKARRGSDDSTANGVLDRLRALATDKFRTNLFYQTPLQPLDFRRYADNPDGGYGYCVTIYCDKNSYGADGQEAIMTFMLAKVLLEGAYSRVDIDRSKRKPFVIELDEPHRFIKGDMAAKLGEDAAVELRKYRAKLTMFGHSRAQLGKLWDAFEAGGIQVTMYKSKDVQAFRDLRNIISPLDPEEAWAALGEHEAVVTRKIPSKTEVSFICKMAPPPETVKDRSARRDACARQFGRHWKEVSEEIQQRRAEYAAKDRLWNEVEAEKAEAEKERLKAERAAARKHDKASA